MGTKPTSVSISGYNTAPPVDDGTISESNKVKWSGIKTKLADPVKTAVESINTGITGAIGTVIARSSNTQIAANNYDDCFVCTSTFSQTFVGASTLTAGWRCYIVNNGTGTITLTPNGAETINGLSKIVLKPGNGATVISDGSNLFCKGVYSGINLDSPTITSTLKTVNNSINAWVNYSGYAGFADAGVNGWHLESASGDGVIWEWHHPATQAYGYITNDTSAGLAITNGSATFTSWLYYCAAATGNMSLTGTLSQSQSDARLKENLIPCHNPFDRLYQINGYDFSWKENGPQPSRGSDTGFVAQEVAKVFPQSVSLAGWDTDENGNSKSGENYLSLALGYQIIAVLVEAVKELDGRVRALEK